MKVVRKIHQEDGSQCVTWALTFDQHYEKAYHLITTTPEEVIVRDEVVRMSNSYVSDQGFVECEEDEERLFYVHLANLRDAVSQRMKRIDKELYRRRTSIKELTTLEGHDTLL